MAHRNVRRDAWVRRLPGGPVVEQMRRERREREETGEGHLSSPTPTRHAKDTTDRDWGWLVRLSLLAAVLGVVVGMRRRRAR
ncbi:MAG TPA: hypothetical protein VIL00_04660 [Pseudonocardiaceae bacterium]